MIQHVQHRPLAPLKRALPTIEMGRQLARRISTQHASQPDSLTPTHYRATNIINRATEPGPPIIFDGPTIIINQAVEPNYSPKEAPLPSGLYSIHSRKISATRTIGSPSKASTASAGAAASNIENITSTWAKSADSPDWAILAARRKTRAGTACAVSSASANTQLRSPIFNV
ncbi:hypothetical protein [Propionibacterium phage PacnesP2]|uniref:Uncharacterized protein n=1 Tax=Propionibacterium phage PacnesP2 TaxID=1983621 RepID=A0A220NT21_9CAUD|nr:hypothetical protein [Propionibacterium phage PacnesP2]